MYDFIGDIHGFAGKLKELLHRLGYSVKGGVFSHPERKAFFLGDYIDRGPQIEETLQIVRTMTESGNAIALMGNHEYNALCFHYEHKEGGHLRPHNIKNILQHCDTLAQFKGRDEEYKEYLKWFKTLPVYYENENFRAVHACWDDENIRFLDKVLIDNRLNDDLIYRSVEKGTAFHRAIDQTLKGKEMPLPDNITFEDKDGIKRTKIRMKFWIDPRHATYKSISIHPMENLPGKPLDLSQLSTVNYYGEDRKPVFFGHYWFNGMPALQRHNVCCLDYSVAKGGKLVAYRYNGEAKLSDSNFVWV